MDVIDEAGAMVRDKVPLVKRWQEIENLVDSFCEQHGLDCQARADDCRRKVCADVRKELMRKLGCELGVPYGEAACRSGISAPAVSKMVSSLTGS